MRTEIFNSPGLRVFRGDNGLLRCHGTFNGVSIKHAIPVGGECILLLDPDGSKQTVFRNLLRVDRDGNPKWIAELPGAPDAFMDIRLEEGRLVAGTWSGFNVQIDPHSGRQLAQVFVK